MCNGLLGVNLMRDDDNVVELWPGCSAFSAEPLGEAHPPDPHAVAQPVRVSTVDVLDRILDKGVVIDAWTRVSLVGLELLTLETRVVVASVETYLSNAEALAKQPQVA